MTANTPDIYVVLIEPQGPLNIGSVCRSMANFGLSRLRLVNPQADHLCHDARQMAVKATDLLESAQVYDSLNAALSDCHYSFATTRRLGKYRTDTLAPDKAAIEIHSLGQKGSIGLVFGREDHGLSSGEIEMCQRLITIPTHKNFPSMNLAQSVTICLYEIYKAKSHARTNSSFKKLASSKNLEAMMQHMRTTLLNVEYLDPQNPDHILRSFRQIFGRAKLNEREVRILHGLWSRIDWLDNQRKKMTS